MADRVLVLSQRPARVVLEEASPAGRRQGRAETITDSRFVATRERALLALAGERGPR